MYIFVIIACCSSLLTEITLWGKDYEPPRIFLEERSQSRPRIPGIPLTVQTRNLEQNRTPDAVAALRRDFAMAMQNQIPAVPVNQRAPEVFDPNDWEIETLPSESESEGSSSREITQSNRFSNNLTVVRIRRGFIIGNGRNRRTIITRPSQREFTRRFNIL